MRTGKKWHSSRSKWMFWTLVVGVSAVLLPGLRWLHGFLAVNSPVGQGILVVEAWVPPRTLAESVHAFHSGNYRYVIVVGGPMETHSSKSPKTYDEIAAKQLEGLGLNSQRLVRITVPPVDEGYRTLASAAAVKHWLDSCQNPRSIDVYTAGVHARKSWAAFRYILGDHYRVGIIAGNEYIYDSRFWFFSATGIWYVVRDLAGYLYSKFWVPLNTREFARVERPPISGRSEIFGTLPTFSPA